MAKPGHKLPKCTQCGQAYYCNADHQRKHWRKHRPVCQAAVAALARRAHREWLARAVREKGKHKVKGAEEDALCVICQADKEKEARQTRRPDEERSYRRMGGGEGDEAGE